MVVDTAGTGKVEGWETKVRTKLCRRPGEEMGADEAALFVWKDCGKHVACHGMGVRQKDECGD